MRTRSARGRSRAGSSPTNTERRGTPLETNPWFGYLVARDGERIALRVALGFGRAAVTRPGPDCVCGRPTWLRLALQPHHACYACEPHLVVAGAPPVPPVPYRIPEHVELAPADIEIAFGCTGNEYIVLPDEVARALRARVVKGWHEVPASAAGWSLEFRENHWMHAVTSAILTAYATSPVPAGVDEQRAERARQARLRAAAGRDRTATVFVVGRSAWDADEGRITGADGRTPWPDGVRQLVVEGFPHIEPRRDPWTGDVLSGTVAVWAG